MKSSTLRFSTSALLILITAIFLRTRSHGEIFPPRQPLQSFPEHLGEWAGTDLPIDADTLQVLGPGDFLLRTYTSGDQQTINLFIAYFASERTGDTIHSPKNCLPGSGWAPLESRHISVSVPGHVPFPA